MIRPIATGTKTIMSIDVRAEEESGRIMLGAHLFVREGLSDPMTDTNPSYSGVRAVPARRQAPPRPGHQSLRQRQDRRRQLTRPGDIRGSAQRTWVPSRWRAAQ